MATDASGYANDSRADDEMYRRRMHALRDGLPFPEATQQHRDPDDSPAARQFWLLIELFRCGSVEYGSYRDRYGRSQRRFQQDLQRIRERTTGVFEISPRLKSGRAVMTYAYSPQTGGTKAGDKNALRTLASILAAFGGPFQSELCRLGDVKTADAAMSFLRLDGVRSGADDRILKVYEELRGAHARDAMVAFTYRSNKNEITERRAEPYFVTLRSGRYYLVAYDPGRRGWRHFALDAMSSLHRCGSFTKRPVPERYRLLRSAGWIDGQYAETEVTFLVEPPYAAFVQSRMWAPDQRLTIQGNGSVEITMTFRVLTEAVTWAFQFAPHARIIAPPEAVRLAREMATGLVATHGARPQRRQAS